MVRNPQVFEAMGEDHSGFHGGDNSRILRHTDPERLQQEQRAMAWTEQPDIVNSVSTRFSVIVVESKV